MAEILALVGKIILIIEKEVNAIEATLMVAKKSGMDFNTLRDFLPNKWR
ncbi:MAG: hypothetical protein ACREVX_01380 [Clostridium sp.]